MKLLKFYLNAQEHIHNTDARIVAVQVGESGFWPIYTRLTLDDLNVEGVTPEIQEAALCGSMFGWNTPAAAPAVEFARTHGETGDA